MIAIADSGSTKTEWSILDKLGNVRQFFTLGLNPFFVNASFVEKELKEKFPKNISPQNITKVFFYGAGCSSSDRCDIISRGLQSFFLQADVYADHDIMGAAKALFDDKQGIAMIIGTGSNSCVYDGSKITHNIPALGYILGDEGSGAFFGLQLIKDYLNKEMPTDVYDLFCKEYDSPSREDILNRVYKQPFPNRYLAGFAPFLSKYQQLSYVRDLVVGGFDLFFIRHIKPYPNFDAYNLGSVGSVGYFLQDLLTEVAINYGFSSVKILRSPMEGLIEVHKKDV